MGMSLQVSVNFADGSEEVLESGVADIHGLSGMVWTMLDKAKITTYSSLQIIVVPHDAVQPERVPADAGPFTG